MTLASTLTADQHRTLDNLRAAAARIWERPLHRYFTDHGVTHSERILALLEGLTTGIQQTDKRLVPAEIFVLLAAAYLHDIGMQDERFAGGDLEQIRAHHHEQTAEMIYRVFEDPEHAFPIPLGDDPTLVEAIAQVAAGHRKVDLSSPEYEPLQLGDELLRLRLLAALLRFADELDIDYRRVDLEQLKLLDLPVESQLHWWKCHYVAGVRIVDEYIRVAYRFPRARPDYEQLLIPLVENEIRAKHTALEPIFREHGVKVAIGKPQVRLMRLLKPMREEVEALAWEWLGEPDGRLVGEKSARQVTPPAKGAAASGPAHLEQEAGLQRALTMARRVLDILEEQAAGYTTLTIPTHLQIELEEKRLEVADLERRLGLQPERSSEASHGFDQQRQQVGTQYNIAGDYYASVVAEERSVAPHEKVKRHTGNSATGDADSAAGNIVALRRRLRQLDSVEIESLCLDHFSAVYDKFGRGMRRDEMINLLLDHCRRHPEDANRLDDLLK